MNMSYQTNPKWRGEWCKKVHPEVRNFRIIATKVPVRIIIEMNWMKLSSPVFWNCEILHVVALSSFMSFCSETAPSSRSRARSARSPVMDEQSIQNGGDGTKVRPGHCRSLPDYSLKQIRFMWAAKMATSSVSVQLSTSIADGYMLSALRIGAAGGAGFALGAQAAAPFAFRTIQTDHGPEFTTWFTKKLQERQITHRYTRIRKPNDNAHIERFNRTIQDECISRLSHNLTAWQKTLPEYLHYYNHDRPHMGLDWLTPAEKLGKVFPRY